MCRYDGRSLKHLRKTNVALEDYVIVGNFDGPISHSSTFAETVDGLD